MDWLGYPRRQQLNGTQKTSKVDCPYTVAATSLTSWTLTGEIAFPNSGEPGTTALELLDPAGKVICRLNKTEAFPNSPVLANSQQLFSVLTGGAYMRTVMAYLQPFSYSRNGSQVTIRYASYSATVNVFETGADVTQPASLRIRFANDAGRNSSHLLVFAKGKFYSNSQ